MHYSLTIYGYLLSHFVIIWNQLFVKYRLNEFRRFYMGNFLIKLRASLYFRPSISIIVERSKNIVEDFEIVIIKLGTSYFPYIGNRFPTASILVSNLTTIRTGTFMLCAATAQAVDTRADRPSLLPYPPPHLLTLILILKGYISINIDDQWLIESGVGLPIPVLWYIQSYGCILLNCSDPLGGWVYVHSIFDRDTVTSLGFHCVMVLTSHQ